MTESDNETAARRRQAELDAALDGGLDELPPNQVKGILGETMPDLRKEEDFSPDLNSGISQEMDLPVRWMGIVLAMFLFFPLGYYLLWRADYISHRAKVITSVVAAVAIVAFVIMLVLR